MSRSQTPRLTLIAFGVGALALILGYVGYRQLDGGALGSSDALYQAIRLFFLDYNGPRTSPPWQLEIARFSAAGFSLFTVSAVVITLAREQTQKLRIRAWGTRRHILVIGLGDRGRKVSERLRANGPVAIIEKDAANTYVEGARAQGMPTLKGDARQQSILDAARVARARHVLIVAGSDSTGLELLAACQRRLAEEHRPITTLHVAIEDLALWRELHQVSLAREAQPARTEFLSIPDRVARRFVSAVSALPGTSGEDRVLVHGEGALAVRAVVHTVRRSVLAGNSVTVVLAGPNADSIQSEIQALEPWVESVATLELDHRHLLSMRDQPPTVALVCGLGEAAALAAAAGIARQLQSDLTPTYVAVPDKDAEQALKTAQLELAPVHFIAAEAEVLGPDMFEDSALELLARAKHDDYLIQERGRGIDGDQNPSVVPWEELPETLQESNRRFAESVGAKLGEMGATLTALTGAGEDELELPVSNHLLEAMAKREHERWMRDLEGDGWEFSPGPKDPAQKRHPSMIPWESLAQEEREKDREAIRAIPKALASVGYAIRLVEDVDLAASSPPKQS